VFSGHYHLRQHNKNVYYLGSPYQITFNDCGTKKGFHIFDNTTDKLEFVVNSNSIFHTIIYDDTKKDYSSVKVPNYNNCYLKILVANKTNPYLFDRYIEQINDSSPAHINIIEEIDVSIKDADIEFLSEDTLTLINKEIDLISVDVDKNKLKSIVKTLYLDCFE
jgi:DNA repair exonuclease SbcCD nuclease subunit